MNHTSSTPKSIRDTLARICNLSEDTYYNPYKTFQWPDELPEEQWWMSRELMSVAGTRLEEEYSEGQARNRTFLKRTVDKKGMLADAEFLP